MGVRPDAALGYRPSSSLGKAPAPRPLAGGEAKVGRQVDFQAQLPPIKSGLKAFLGNIGEASGLMKKKSSRMDSGRNSKGVREGEAQQIGNAEALWARNADPIELQLSQFSDVYNKVIIFRRKTREVIFVTKEFLKFSGFPCEDMSQVFQNTLIHTDILDYLVPHDNSDYRPFRKTIQDAINASQPLSIKVGVRALKKRSVVEVKAGVLHLTPLADGQGVVEAIVAV
ncbi:hypothetical protein T439DRAFT_176372 [Meredithblackwellia eburnea MCA 4105]